MISYLNEQPRTQALADALRGTAASSGGTQMPDATPMPGSSLTPPPPPDFNQYGNGTEGGGADLGKALKGGWEKYGDDIMGFGGGKADPSALFGSGAGNGAPYSASASPHAEAANMGWGDSMADSMGGGWMDSISSMFGGGGGGGGSLFGSGAGNGASYSASASPHAESASGGMFGGGMGGGDMGGIYGMVDNMFGDKFYGKQEGNDETSGTGDAARSALTSAAYSNPYSAAALWADRLLFKGKGMDTLTGWLD